VFRSDPHHVDADPDPAFHFNADPDPTFHLDAVPDPTIYFHADPDPDPSLQIRIEFLKNFSSRLTFHTY